jgi:hypothetical protein
VGVQVVPELILIEHGLPVPRINYLVSGQPLGIKLHFLLRLCSSVRHDCVMVGCRQHLLKEIRLDSSITKLRLVLRLEHLADPSNALIVEFVEEDALLDLDGKQYDVLQLGLVLNIQPKRVMHLIGEEP